MVKRVFVAHPIRGDIEGNKARVRQICRDIHTEEMMPVAPYLATLEYLDDTVPERRKLGIEAGLEYIRSRFVDEVWLYGDRITDGMWREILVAVDAGVLVIAKTEGTRKALNKARLCRCDGSSVEGC